MLLTINLVLILVYFITLNRGHPVRNAWQFFVEIIYDFVPNLVNKQISSASSMKQQFFPLFFVIFTFYYFVTLLV
jgi:F0F1-type ATP synthase membrane subunit a